jgi:hypothetical protein
MIDSWLIKIIVQWLTVTTLAGWTVHCQWYPEDSGSYRVYLQTVDRFDQVASDFVQGDTATLRLSLENTGDTTLTFRSDSSQRVEFDVETLGGSLVWRWSEANDLFFSPVISELSVSPGDTVTWSVEWPQEYTDGRLVPVNEYLVTGTVFGAGSDTRRIRVL